MERNLSALRSQKVSYSAEYKDGGAKEKNNETVSIIRSKGLGGMKLISSEIEILKLEHYLTRKDVKKTVQDSGRNSARLQ